MNKIEYRAFELSNNSEQNTVEGYATKFAKPYLFLRHGGNDYFEQIDEKAFDNADLSDVIMQYDHEGKVLARTSNNTLEVAVDNIGLRIKADLSKSENARNLYEEIQNGLVTKMSFSFSVVEESFNQGTRTRRITKIGKLYDVSAVSIPANDDTEIYVRHFVKNAELELLKLKIKLFN
ncbi:hypothetical protein FACS1894132_09750 [Clostridia bacterium]|nr:hypothetical protein FACS1894132_09750 [Clostridia bacterium]